MNRFRSVKNGVAGSITRRWKRAGRFIKKKSGGAKEIHQCPECKKKFLYKNTLTKHVVIHSDERPFSCDKCIWAFKRKDLLARHIIRRHSEEGAGGGVQEELVTIKTEPELVTVKLETNTIETELELVTVKTELPICDGVEGAREIRPRRHRHAAKRCPCCVSSPPSMASTSTMSGHHHHHQAVPKKKLTVAAAAPRPLAVAVRFQSEGAEAESGVAYKCDQCGKGYSSKSNLTRHLVNNHAYSWKRVGRTKTNFTPKKILVHSHRGGGGVQCSQCGNCYTLKCNMVRHFQKAHAQSQAINIRGLATNQNGTRTRPVKKSNSTVIQSIVGQSGGTGADDDAKKAERKKKVKPNPKEPLSPNQCPVCKLFMASRKNVVRHMLVHNEERPYVCGFCIWTFKRRDTFIDHLRLVHGKSKEMAQKLSKKGIGTKSGFSKSAKKASGDVASGPALPAKNKKIAIAPPAHQCPECRLFFFSKRKLGNHMPIHEVVRPFACRLCVWTFKRRDTLFNHLKRKHGKSEKVARNMVSASGVNVKNSCYNMRERVQPGAIVSTSSTGSGDVNATTAPIRERKKAPWLCKPVRVPVVDNREVIVIVGQFKFCTPGLLVKPPKRVVQGCATFQESFWETFNKTVEERNYAPLIKEEPELNMSLNEIAELIV